MLHVLITASASASQNNKQNNLKTSYGSYQVSTAYKKQSMRSIPNACPNVKFSLFTSVPLLKLSQLTPIRAVSLCDMIRTIIPRQELGSKQEAALTLLQVISRII